MIRLAGVHVRRTHQIGVDHFGRLSPKSPSGALKCLCRSEARLCKCAARPTLEVFPTWLQTCCRVRMLCACASCYIWRLGEALPMKKTCSKIHYPNSYQGYVACLTMGPFSAGPKFIECNPRLSDMGERAGKISGTNLPRVLCNVSLLPIV